MIILASQSPRRRELLANAGYRFVVRPSELEELRLDGESAEGYVRRLAIDKAHTIDATPADFVLAADTTVLCEGELLEKPLDTDDARRMLTKLSGRWHEVLTGVCVRHGRVSLDDVESTAVRFLPLSTSDIEYYVASGEHADKAGAYGIQGLASRFIDRVEGCYYNVVGLPVSRVARLLKQAGYEDSFRASPPA